MGLSGLTESDTPICYYKKSQWKLHYVNRALTNITYFEEHKKMVGRCPWE